MGAAGFELFSTSATSIRGDFGGPDFTKYKGEVLIFIFWKKVAKKGWFVFLLPFCLSVIYLVVRKCWFMFLLPIFVYFSSILSTFWI